MARAGMTRWRSRNCAPVTDGCDEVQKSLDLLDRVLSEFDEAEPTAEPVTPEDEGPAGHQSEDDGYMSMNGRKTRMQSPGGKKECPPPPEEAERIISTLLPRVSPCSSSKRNPNSDREFLRSVAHSIEQEAGFDRYGRRVTTATQTTLPKTKHQRPFGWQKDEHKTVSCPANEGQKGCSKYGSLPYDGAVYYENYPPPWLQRQPGQAPVRLSSIDRRREARRHEEELLNTVHETDDDAATFSDDSLEDSSPVSKRGSVAWEVPLDSDMETYTPGSTKVIGRRRCRSTDRSSAGSLSMLNLQDDWPEPPNGTDESLSCFTSDTDMDSTPVEDHPKSEKNRKSKNFNCGTYVIRRMNKKDQLQLKDFNSSTENISTSPLCNGDTELKRCSSTFDNIKILLKEGLVEGLNESPPDFHPPRPPVLVRGVSLPNLLAEEEQKPYNIKNYQLEQSNLKSSSSSSESIPAKVFISKGTSPNNMEHVDAVDTVDKHSVAIQVSADFSQLNKEIAEQSAGCQTDVDELSKCVAKALIVTETIPIVEPATRLDSSIEDLLIEKPSNSKFDRKLVDTLSRKCNGSGRRSESTRIRISNGPESENRVEVASRPKVFELENRRPDSRQRLDVCNGFKPLDFGPLPPSPVEEVEDEFVEMKPPMSEARKPDDLYRSADYRRTGRSSLGSARSRAPDVPPHRDPSSLKTRSVDAGFTRSHRSQQFLGSRKEVPVERRTLPTDLPGTHRRPYAKRGSRSPDRGCSLPETPIFARGCDVPRTPMRDTPSRTAPRLNGIQTTYGRGHGTCLGEAMAGAELLRLAGPGRGWYPRHRQPRPASVEHLDRLSSPGTPGAWDRDARKPLTLPPNLSPKFFQRSPREALRRVTSLLVRKGGNPKDTKSKDVLTSSVIGPHGDFSDTSRTQKRGFFRNWWKRSRHYSLDQQ